MEAGMGGYCARSPRGHLAPGNPGSRQRALVVSDRAARRRYRRQARVALHTRLAPALVNESGLGRALNTTDATPTRLALLRPPGMLRAGQGRFRPGSPLLSRNLFSIGPGAE